MSTRLSWPYQMSVAFFRMVFRWGYRRKVYGLEHVPSTGGVILAGNHVSYLDPPLIAVHCSRQPVYSFARQTLFQHGMGWWFRRLYMLEVDRDKGSDLHAFRQVLQLLQNHQVVQMFPEGTRSPNGVLQRGKKGVGWFLLKGRVPVVPVRVFGTFEAWPKGKRFPSFRPQISVVFGKPLLPDDFASCQNDPDPYQAASDRVMQAIANLHRPIDEERKGK
ncbi:MAG: 1-acyl-sn-glycerol-3-phosphate acyltransferase [Opitutales bacterium]|nr:1-acyl-sn-glycerol-3-phosphate acyltransferase [Opitutales bacterium]